MLIHFVLYHMCSLPLNISISLLISTVEITPIVKLILKSHLIKLYV